MSRRAKRNRRVRAWALLDPTRLRDRIAFALAVACANHLAPRRPRGVSRRRWHRALSQVVSPKAPRLHLPAAVAWSVERLSRGASPFQGRARAGRPRR